jgi:nucleoside-diphosphate-sugar epimerase
MKIVLTGSTGFAGSEVLAQCLAAPHITSIIVLSRRSLPETHLQADPQSKITNVTMKDFEVYPADVVTKIQDADACIW